MNRPPPAARWRASRRSSFARRDSNLALLGAMVSGVVLALALTLLIVQRVDPAAGSALRGGMADALAPLVSVARAPVDAARAIGSALAEHWQVVEANRTLKSALAAAERRAARADALAAEVARMDRLIALRRPERRLVASGVASASSASGAVRQAVISVGVAHGVRPRMPVIAADGLAGRVTDVGRGAARIMLLTDANSRVPVRLLRTGWTGLLVGTGGARLEFHYDIGSGRDRIRVGDRLVTSGDGGLYPPDVPVGVVTDASVNPPRVRPLANPTGLGPVMVEAPWLPPPPLVPAAPARAEPDRPMTAPTPSPPPADAPVAAPPGVPPVPPGVPPVPPGAPPAPPGTGSP